MTLLIALFVMFGSAEVFGQLSATVLLQGIILNAQTRKPVSASILFRDANGNKVNETRSNAAQGGAYQCVLKPGARYNIELRAEGFMTIEDTITVPSATRYTELSRDFVLLPKAVGQRFVVSIPLFELNSAELRVGAEEELIFYANLLKHNPDVHFSIECYPDRPDSPDTLARLSTRRAQVIITFLARYGISPSRLSSVTLSTTDPYNPPPRKPRPKGRFYSGGTYFVIGHVQK